MEAKAVPDLGKQRLDIDLRLSWANLKQAQTKWHISGGSRVRHCQDVYANRRMIVNERNVSVLFVVFGVRRSLLQSIKKVRCASRLSDVLSLALFFGANVHTENPPSPSPCVLCTAW